MTKFSSADFKRWGAEGAKASAHIPKKTRQKWGRKGAKIRAKKRMLIRAGKRALKKII